MGCALELTDFDPSEPAKANGRGKLSIVDVPLRDKVIPGQLNPANSPYVIDVLQAGFDLCYQKKCDALLTLPVHKAVIAQSGIPFMGHTEHFAQLAGVDDVLMSFFTPKLIVGLVTTHYTLKAVPELITPERVRVAIQLLAQGLTQIFKRPNPRIGILGLNPHAGENGLLGREELDCITPVIKEASLIPSPLLGRSARRADEGITLIGPLSGDTAFTPHSLSGLDAILAMYHDQGLAPLKALYFGQIVNVTLGLPFLRISVDHGTALDKAGTHDISTQSLESALSLLSQWAATR